VARDPRIEQARERLRRLKPPPGSAAARLEQLRERARAARAAHRPGTPPPWTPPAEPPAPAPPAAGDPSPGDQPDATPAAPADDSPLSVPFRPASREPSAGAGEELPPAVAGKPGGSRFEEGIGAVREAAEGAGHWISDRWATLPDVGRARVLAVAIVAALAAIVWFVVLPSAPCAAPGGDQCPPGDDAIALVPDDAVAYVHLEVDADSGQFQSAQEVAARLPLLTRLAVAEVSSVAGQPIDFDEDVRPWSGGETALAVLPGTGAGEQVLMLEAADEDGARDFSDELLGPAAVSNDIGGTEVLVGEDGFSTALYEGFLLLGTKAAISEVVDRPVGADSLEQAPAASVLDRLPSQSLAYAYLSPEGARELLGAGPLAPLDTFVDADASSGVAAALTADGDYAELAIRSDLDPDRSATSPGFFAALPGFEPSLTANVGADALAYLGLGDPASSIDSLREQAAVGAPELLAAFDRFEKDLRRDGGISLEDDLIPLLGSEVALSVEPVFGAQEEGAPGTLIRSGTPYVSLIAAGIDETAAATALAELQQPLIDALATEQDGQLPSFEASQIAGVEAQSLFVSPQVDLTYATFADRLVIATNRLGISQARAGDGGLGASDAYAGLTEGMPDEVSLFAYLNLGGLIDLGEQVGLAEDPAYAAFAPDLRNLRAAALSVVGGEETIDTDVRIATGAPEEAEVDPSPVVGE